MHLVARENIDLSPTQRVRVGEVFTCSDDLAAKYLGRRAARLATAEETTEAFQRLQQLASAGDAAAIDDLPAAADAVLQVAADSASLAEATPPAPKRSSKPRAAKSQA